MIRFYSQKNWRKFFFGKTKIIGDFAALFQQYIGTQLLLELDGQRGIQQASVLQRLLLILDQFSRIDGHHLERAKGKRWLHTEKGDFWVFANHFLHLPDNEGAHLVHGVRLVEAADHGLLDVREAHLDACGRLGIVHANLFLCLLHSGFWKN